MAKEIRSYSWKVFQGIALKTQGNRYLEASASFSSKNVSCSGTLYLKHCAKLFYPVHAP